MAILCWCILSSQEINFILLSINSVIKAGSAFLNFIFLNHDHLGCNKFHLQLCGNFETTLRFFRDINLQSVSFATLWQRSKLRSVKILTWNQCHATLWQRCYNLMFYWDMNMQSVSITTLWQRWDNIAFFQDINLQSVLFATLWQHCNNVRYMTKF